MSCVALGKGAYALRCIAMRAEMEVVEQVQQETKIEMKRECTSPKGDSPASCLKRLVEEVIGYPYSNLKKQCIRGLYQRMIAASISCSTVLEGLHF